MLRWWVGYSRCRLHHSVSSMFTLIPLNTLECWFKTHKHQTVCRPVQCTHMITVLYKNKNADPIASLAATNAYCDTHHLIFTHSLWYRYWDPVLRECTTISLSKARWQSIKEHTTECELWEKTYRHNGSEYQQWGIVREYVSFFSNP